LFREHAKTTKTSADLPENVIRVLAIKVNKDIIIVLKNIT